MAVEDYEEFFVLFLGAVMAGVIPVPLTPASVIGDRQNYLSKIQSVLKATNVTIFVCGGSSESSILRLKECVTPHCRFITSDDVLKTPCVSLEPACISSEDVCFLQLTSGSTSTPKAVVVTHGNLLANAHAMLGQTLSVNPHQDLVVSWLPMYHDMGLVGNFLSALMFGLSVVYIPTSTFIKQPQVWMKTVSRFRATITFGSNFSLFLVCRRANESYLRDLDLASLRVLGCGAEPINPGVLERFRKLHAKPGLRSEAIMPCYGMAEATLAISFDSLSRPPLYKRIEREACETQGIAREMHAGSSAESVKVVSCGVTFPGHSLRIVSREGATVPDGFIGEICFSGPSVALGYYQLPAETCVTFREKWLHTGDLGFISDGNLYVVGRIKDIIIVNGRNFSPTDFEWTVEEMGGARVRSSAAFGIQGEATEKLVVVVEVKSIEATDGLKRELEAGVLANFGVPANISLVAPGTIPRTSSGKIKRQDCRRLYEHGILSSSRNSPPLIPSMPFPACSTDGA